MRTPNFDPELRAQLDRALAELAAKHDEAFQGVISAIASEKGPTPQQRRDRWEALIIYQLSLPDDLESATPLTTIVNEITVAQGFRRTAQRVHRDLVGDLRLFHDVPFPGSVEEGGLSLLSSWWHAIRQWLSR
jgi:hypothetical protein